MPQAPTIFVIEDEQLLLEAIRKKLEFTGFSVVAFSSAEQALGYIDSAGVVPDLIWLDYYLKGMNGIGFVKELKNREAYKSVPIIVVSNSTNEDRIGMMLSLGVKKYLLKAEYRLDELITIIRTYINDAAKQEGAHA